MPSSTSSSERIDASNELPTAERVRRVVPVMPRFFWLVALAITALGVGAWEWQMRSIGLTTADLGDGPGQWSVERRKVDAGEADIAVIGDSRILFDTDLALLREMTGARVVQLATVGTNASFLLENLANDEDFEGLVILGITELSYFRPAKGGAGYGGRYMGYFDVESPSQRIGHRLQVALSHVFAFIDENHRLSELAAMVYWPRRYVRTPYDNPWKVMETRADRQTWMWDAVWKNPWRLAQARHAWNDFAGPPVDEATIVETIARSKAAIGKIRARGGEVVYVRPPSSDPVLANEKLRAPRDKVWERLLRETNTVGLYYADDPLLVAMDVPEYSHLSPPCARLYTWAYVKALRERVPRFASKPVDVDALRPTETCEPRDYPADPRPPFPEMPPKPPA